MACVCLLCWFSHLNWMPVSWDWGFNLRDIEVPVTIWQGDLDLMVPFEHGQWLIKHIPNASSQLKIGEGHISLVAKYKPEMIEDLIKNRN